MTLRYDSHFLSAAKEVLLKGLVLSSLNLDFAIIESLSLSSSLESNASTCLSSS